MKGPFELGTEEANGNVPGRSGREGKRRKKERERHGVAPRREGQHMCFH